MIYRGWPSEKLVPTVSTQRPVRTGPLTITITLVPSQDEELTCWVCSRIGCELAWESLPGPGNRAVAGLHSRCLERFGEVTDA